MDPGTAILGGSFLNLIGGMMGGSAMSGGVAMSQQQWREYLDTLKQIYSRENIYSPGQISTQDALFPLYWGFLTSSIGAPPELAAEALKTAELTPMPSDEELMRKAQAKYGSGPRTSGPRNKYIREEKARIQALNEKEKVENARITEEAKQAYEHGQMSYNLQENFMKAQLDKQRGAEQSAMDVAKQNAIQELMNRGRQMMGGGTSGHVMGQIGGLEQEYLKMRPQLDTNRQLREQEWRVQTLQDALGQLGGMAYGQPVGNQPYTPPEPPAPYVNMWPANFMNQIGNASSMYFLNRAMNKNNPGSNYRTFGYPSSMTA